MIDRILVRPVLAVGTFIKRNPLLSLLLLAILFMLPPLIFAVSLVFQWALRAIKAVFGLKVAESVAKVLSNVMTWMQNNSYACPAFALVIGFFSPLVGGLLTAWCFVDKLKTGPEVKVLALPPPDPLPDTPIEPDLSDSGTSPVDDFFNSSWA